VCVSGPAHWREDRCRRWRVGSRVGGVPARRDRRAGAANPHARGFRVVLVDLLVLRLARNIILSALRAAVPDFVLVVPRGLGGDQAAARGQPEPVPRCDVLPSTPSR
jgi:hypothetical protein